MDIPHRISWCFEQCHITSLYNLFFTVWRYSKTRLSSFHHKGHPSVTAPANFCSGMSNFYSTFLTSSYKPVLSVIWRQLIHQLCWTPCWFHQEQRQKVALCHSLGAFVRCHRKPLTINDFHPEVFFSEIFLDSSYGGKSLRTNFRNYCIVRDCSICGCRVTKRFHLC